MQENALVVKNLSKKYGDTMALNDVTFNVKRGELFIVMGPSPSGKSTLLRCIAGLERPDSGSIWIGGVNVEGVPTSKRNISLVFQDLALFPHMTVFDNVAFGLRVRGYSRDRIRNEVEEVAKLVAIEGLLDRYPKQLSGGQQQRVALARSLILKPAIILFDEPLENLDPEIREKTMEELKLLHQKIRFTGIYVTHDQAQAMTLADRMMIMNQGVIEQIGTPEEIYMNPSSIFVARFVGEINMLKGVVSTFSDGAVTVKTEAGNFKAPMRDGIKEGMSIAYAVRPEKILIGDDAENCDNKVKANLAGYIYKGSSIHYIFTTKNGTKFKGIKLTHKRKDTRLYIGSEISIGWNLKSSLLFPLGQVEYQSKLNTITEQ